MRTLKSRLILLNVLFIALFGLVLVTQSFLQLRTEVRDGLNLEFSATLRGQSTVIQNWFGEKKQQLSALTGVAAGPNALANLKQGAVAGNFFINYVGFPDGRSIFSDDWVATPDYIVTEKPWYVQAKTTGKPTITEPYVDQVSKRLVLTVAVPMLEGGQFHGVVAGDVFVDELVKSVLSLKPRGDGYTFIVNKQGTVIAHPDNALTLKSISSIAPSLVPERLAAIAESHALNEVDINGKTMLVAIEQIPGTDWYMGITADKDLIFAPLNAELFKTVGMSMLLFILVGVVSSVVIGRMLSGLTRLRDAMAGIASGEGEGDLTIRLDARGRDEIADTGRAFNQFVAKLAHLFGELQGEAQSLIGGVKEASGHVAGLADGARQMADVSSNNAATLEEISVSISHIADTATQADALIRDTNGDLSNCSSNMHQLSVSIEETVKAVHGMEDMLTSLDNSTQDISSITEVIRDIADQTNLLALNAAIEAARAGEQGRGFAVVADEVRKLAERTAQATLEISHRVDSIRQETGNVVSDMKRTVEAVDAGVVLPQTAAGEISAVRESMDEVVSKMNDIALSTTEQHKASTLIAQSTEAINNQVIGNDDALHSVSGALTELSGTAERMQGVFGRFKL